MGHCLDTTDPAANPWVGLQRNSPFRCMRDIGVASQIRQRRICAGKKSVLFETVFHERQGLGCQLMHQARWHAGIAEPCGPPRLRRAVGDLTGCKGEAALHPCRIDRIIG